MSEPNFFTHDPSTPGEDANEFVNPFDSWTSDVSSSDQNLMYNFGNLTNLNNFNFAGADVDTNSAPSFDDFQVPIPKLMPELNQMTTSSNDLVNNQQPQHGMGSPNGNHASPGSLKSSFNIPLNNGSLNPNNVRENSFQRSSGRVQQEESSNSFSSTSNNNHSLANHLLLENNPLATYNANDSIDVGQGWNNGLVVKASQMIHSPLQGGKISAKSCPQMLQKQQSKNRPIAVPVSKSKAKSGSRQQESKKNWNMMQKQAVSQFLGTQIHPRLEALIPYMPSPETLEKAVRSQSEDYRKQRKYLIHMNTVETFCQLKKQSSHAYPSPLSWEEADAAAMQANLQQLEAEEIFEDLMSKMNVTGNDLDLNLFKQTRSFALVAAQLLQKQRDQSDNGTLLIKQVDSNHREASQNLPPRKVRSGVSKRNNAANRRQTAHVFEAHVANEKSRIFNEMLKTFQDNGVQVNDQMRQSMLASAENAARRSSPPAVASRENSAANRSVQTPSSQGAISNLPSQTHESNHAGQTTGSANSAQERADILTAMKTTPPPGYFDLPTDIKPVVDRVMIAKQFALANKTSNVNEKRGRDSTTNECPAPKRPANRQNKKQKMGSTPADHGALCLRPGPDLPHNADVNDLSNEAPTVPLKNIQAARNHIKNFQKKRPTGAGSPHKKNINMSAGNAPASNVQTMAPSTLTSETNAFPVLSLPSHCRPLPQVPYQGVPDNTFSQDVDNGANAFTTASGPEVGLSLTLPGGPNHDVTQAPEVQSSQPSPSPTSWNWEELENILEFQGEDYLVSQVDDDHPGQADNDLDELFNLPMTPKEADENDFFDFDL